MIPILVKVMTSGVEQRPRLVTSGYGRHRRKWVNDVDFSVNPMSTRAAIRRVIFSKNVSLYPNPSSFLVGRGTLGSRQNFSKSQPLSRCCSSDYCEKNSTGILRIMQRSDWLSYSYTISHWRLECFFAFSAASRKI